MTAALAAGDESRLPGELRRGDPGELAWEAGTLSIPVAGVGTLLVPSPPPDDDLLAAAESAGAQIALWNETRGSAARRRAMLDVAFDSVVTMDDRGVVLDVNRAAERTFGYPAADMIGREVAELIIPPHLRDAHRSGLARYLKTGRGPVVGRRVELTAMRADGSEFPVELVVTRPETIPPTPRVFYGYLRDLSSRYVAEASLHRLADEQAALRRVATAVATRTDPGDVFAVVTEEVARLLEAQSATLIRFDGDSAIAVGAWNQPGVRGVPLGTVMPLDRDSVAVRVFRTGAPARVEDYDALDGVVARELRRVGFRSSVAAPVFLGGRLWGAMVLLSVDAHPFPDGAEQRIADFAELAAQALANAQAREDLAASRARIVQAGDAERRRLERNLHDGAQQRLVSLALMLRLAARRHPDDADLERAGEELSHALQELRELARGIHPAVLTERGLEPALRALADRAPLPVELDVADGRLPGPVEAAAYYVVAEALTNVAKYARASLVRVRVDRRDGTAAIEVADDGAGGADPRGGSGLRGLADRVEALGGRLEIDSPPGEGTTLRAAIPVSQPPVNPTRDRPAMRDY